MGIFRADSAGEEQLGEGRKRRTVRTRARDRLRRRETETDKIGSEYASFAPTTLIRAYHLHMLTIHPTFAVAVAAAATPLRQRSSMPLIVVFQLTPGSRTRKTGRHSSMRGAHPANQARSTVITATARGTGKTFFSFFSSASLGVSAPLAHAPEERHK